MPEPRIFNITAVERTILDAIIACLPKKEGSCRIRSIYQRLKEYFAGNEITISPGSVYTAVKRFCDYGFLTYVTKLPGTDEKKLLAGVYEFDFNAYWRIQFIDLPGARKSGNKARKLHIPNVRVAPPAFHNLFDIIEGERRHNVILQEIQRIENEIVTLWKSADEKSYADSILMRIETKEHELEALRLQITGQMKEATRLATAIRNFHDCSEQLTGQNQKEVVPMTKL